MVAALLWLLVVRYWRDAVDMLYWMGAIACGSVTSVWADGLKSHGALLAVTRCVQLSLRVPLWLLVWAPVTTCLGTVALLGDRWPLVLPFIIFAGQVVLAAWQVVPPPADACANLMWLTADIRAVTGMQPLSWIFLQSAQDVGAGILAAWLIDCNAWEGLVSALICVLNLPRVGPECQALTAEAAAGSSA